VLTRRGMWGHSLGIETRCAGGTDERRRCGAAPPPSLRPAVPGQWTITSMQTSTRDDLRGTERGTTWWMLAAHRCSMHPQHVLQAPALRSDGAARMARLVGTPRMTGYGLLRLLAMALVLGPSWGSAAARVAGVREWAMASPEIAAFTATMPRAGLPRWLGGHARPSP